MSIHPDLTWLDSRGRSWAYLYLLRVPLLTWLALILLAPLAVPYGAPLGPLLRGLFDLAPAVTDMETALRAAFAFTLVTLQALMLATAVAVCSRLVVLDGAERFGAGVLPRSPGIALSHRLLPALAAVSLLAGAWWQTARGTRSWASLFATLGALGLGTGLGLCVFWILATKVQDDLWDTLAGRHSRVAASYAGRTYALLLSVATTVATPLLAIAEMVARLSPPGYMNARGRLRARHTFAVFQVVLSLLVYGALWLANGQVLVPTGWVPTLCLVLTLLMLLCWILSALTFFLDRFRLPVLLVIVLYGTLLAWLPQSDSFYASRDWPPTQPTPQGCPVAQMGRNPGVPVVLVTTTGGGIQAAAWTARVLATLHRDSEHEPDARRFDRAVRVISAVSGGSVGAMHVVDAYDELGRLPATGRGPLEAYAPVRAAETSSLDAVAWGLTYPDFVASVMPLAKGTPLVPFTTDRGSALEDTWRARLRNPTATMKTWRDDTVNGTRPAVIFNATLVETGERLLLSSNDLDGCWDRPRSIRQGRRDFRSLYPRRDIDVVTAARLSATFPYVSPAARIYATSAVQPDYHVVDGGYYDNYGVATLIEWLDLALADGAPASRILLLEIRSFPGGEAPRPDGSRGWLFQAVHPLLGLWNVRGTGQFSRNELDVRLLRRLQEGKGIERVVFEFPGRIDGRQARPPLSWHLTPADQDALAILWDPAGPLTKCREAVQRFLNGGRAGKACDP